MAMYIKYCTDLQHNDTNIYETCVLHTSRFDIDDLNCK